MESSLVTLGARAASTVLSLVCQIVQVASFGPWSEVPRWTLMWDLPTASGVDPIDTGGMVGGSSCGGRGSLTGVALGDVHWVVSGPRLARTHQFAYQVSWASKSTQLGGVVTLR